jgi:GMP synthase PP-ATPase subunit
VAGEVVKEKESNLRKADAVKLQELRQATTDAIDALQSYVRLIDRSLHAGTPKDATSL